MPRVPYERLAIEANKLLEKMTLATDLQEINYWWDAYVSLLENAGWDPISFEKEMSKKVDEGWEDKPKIWN